MIRYASQAGLESLLEIYSWYVTHTNATFDEKPPTPQEWRQKFAKSSYSAPIVFSLQKRMATLWVWRLRGTIENIQRLTRPPNSVFIWIPIIEVGESVVNSTQHSFANFGLRNYIAPSLALQHNFCYAIDH